MQSKPTQGFFISGILLAIASLSLGWLTPDFAIGKNNILIALRLTEVGRLIGISSLFLGALLLTLMWLAIRHENHSQADHVKIALAASLPTLLVPPLFSRDVYSYIAQGHLQLAGFNPYKVGVSKLDHWFNFGIDPMWAETTTPYGAAYLLIEKFAAAIGANNVYLSMVILRAINILALVLTIYGLHRLASIHNISTNFAIWLAVLNPIAILHLINAVHNDGIMIAALVWGFVFAHKKRLITSSLVIAFAIAIKPIALIALPFLAISKTQTFELKSRIRDWSVSIAGSAAVLVALGIITKTGFGWTNAITTPGAVLNLAAPISLLSETLTKSLAWFGHDIGATIFPLVRITGLVFCAIYIAWLALDKREISGTRRTALALSCMILLSPVVFPWYFLWPLTLFAASGFKTNRAMKITVYGTLLVVVYSIIEAVVVRDSAITSTEIFFSTFVTLSIFSLMMYKENHVILNSEQAYVD